MEDTKGRDQLSHIDDTGSARMVDISGKPSVKRRARARGSISLSPETIALVRENGIRKGDVLSVARTAGIMAAKRAWDLIPLCHNIEIDQVSVDFEINDDSIDIDATALCTDKTGI